MKQCYLIMLLLANLPVYGQVVTEWNDPNKRPAWTNSNFVDEINGQPVDYYLMHDKISQTAKMFYKGQWAISDDRETFAFLDSILTNDKDTRPFYLFIFNQVIRMSDGAVSEYVSTICSEFLTKYPCEFITISGNKKYNFDLDKWTDFIGFALYDSSNYQSYMADIDRRVKQTCSEKKAVWENLRAKVWDKLEEK